MLPENYDFFKCSRAISFVEGSRTSSEEEPRRRNHENRGKGKIRIDIVYQRGKEAFFFFEKKNPPGGYAASLKT